MKALWKIKGLSKATDWRKWYVFKWITFVGKIFANFAAPHSYLPVSIDFSIGGRNNERTRRAGRKKQGDGA